MNTNLNKIIRLLLLSFVISFSLQSCKKEVYQVKTIKAEQIKIDGSEGSDESITAFVEPYKEELEAKVNEVISYTPKTLTRKDGTMQSSLGNVYADICLKRSDPVFEKINGNKIDLAFFNYGGVRQSIPKGDITVGDIFKLMPFENMLVVVELSGKKTKELFDYFEKHQQAHPFSGAKITMNNDQKITSIKIQGKPFDINKNYFVLTSDYLQHGGDHMDFFKDPVHLYGLNYKIRDAILDYLKQTDTLKAHTDDRITIK